MQTMTRDCLAAQPCGGERLLLMFDRWRKLLKAFYNEKKRQFDISKVKPHARVPYIGSKR